MIFKKRVSGNDKAIHKPRKKSPFFLPFTLSYLIFIIISSVLLLFELFLTPFVYVFLYRLLVFQVGK